MLDKIKDKIQYFRQHKFVQQALVLQTGNLAGNFAQALIGVFLARFLQPHLFGIYSIAISLGSLASLFLGFGAFNAAAPLLGEHYVKKEIHIVREILGFLIKMVIWSGILGLAYMAILPWIGLRFYGDMMIGLYAGLAVIALILASTSWSFLLLCLQLVDKVKTMAQFTAADQFLRYGFTLIFVLVGFGVVGAVSGQAVGAAAIVIAAATYWKKLRHEHSIFPSFKNLIILAKNVSFKKYFGFTFWVTIDRNMGNFYMTLPVVLAGVYVSATEVTYFKLAFGYINLVMSLLGPISTLLNMEFSKMKAESQDTLARNFIKISMYAMGLSALLTVVAVAVSPIAFRILYGINFMPSVKYVAGFFVYGTLFGIGVGLGPMWRTINKVKVSILINTIILAVGIPTGILLIKQFGNWGAVIMVTLWFTVSHFISFVYLYKKLKAKSI